MAATNASSLKEKGNVSFKRGDLTDAIKYYALAEKADPTDAVYPSNSSAALYELGEYNACLDAIRRSFELLSVSGTGASPNLALRLSTRFAKALCHGVRSGSLTPQMLEQYKDISMKLKENGSNLASISQEHVRAWQEWEKIEKEGGDRILAAKEALGRLSRLPIFRCSPDPGMEYYSIGQDDPMSIVDDWGIDCPDPIELDKIQPSQLSELSFFFGGVGDARHVWSSLIGLHKASTKLSAEKRSRLRSHMTLNDIHPTPLARDLCFSMLISQLMEAPNDRDAQLEIKATFLYSFAGVIMPPYSHERLMKIIEDLQARLLETPPRLPEWVHVDSDAIQPIVEVLKFWKTVLSTKTTPGILHYHDYKGVKEKQKTLLDTWSISPTYRAKLEERKQERRQELSEFVDTLGEAELNQLYRVSGAPAGASRSQRRESVIDIMLEEMSTGNGSNGDMATEDLWYEWTSVFLPPSELWKRHPGFDVYRDMKGGKPPPNLRGLMKKIKTQIKNTWIPNVTLFDEFTNERTEYPDMHLDIFQLPRAICDFNQRFGLEDEAVNTKLDSPAFLHISHFLDATVDALKALNGRIKLEISCGELTQELAKMRFGSDSTRPTSFPRSFTRIWLSNVPDYTNGAINTVVYVLPNLQPQLETSAAASNCLLNTGIWHDDDEFVYNYTLLHPSDVPRYLGCRLISMDAIQNALVLGPTGLPLPLSKLASRQELTTWLTRKFLCTVIQGHPGHGPVRVMLPNNLVAFVGLMVHLKGVGYPAHWLSEFLESILNDEVVTDVAPYRGKLPIPLSEVNRRVPRRRVALHPWQAELESIIVTAQQGIPFAISMPCGLASSVDDIGVFQVKIMSLPWKLALTFNAFDHVTNLLFYKSSGGLAPDDLVFRIPSILDGHKSLDRGDIHILTVLDFVDLTQHIARWRMSKERVRRMKQENWSVVLYRSDLCEGVTIPVPASQWKTL